MSASGEPSSSTNPDLESFREQWRAEVRSRNPQAAGGASGPASSTQQHQPQPQPQHHHRHNHHRHAPSTSSIAAGPSVITTSTAHTRLAGHPRTQPPPPTHKPPVLKDYEDDYVQPRSFDDPEAVSASAGDGEVGHGQTAGVSTAPKEPVSALDHYEKAVERESAGSLGDSLRLYRKAFRMDDRVDQQYKNKHFPKAAVKTAVGPSTTTSAPAAAPDKPLTMKELIASFSTLHIEPAQPEIEGMPQPPCPIASLPDEILVHILRDVAIQDVGDYVRLARVCKRLAYLVATEDRIWRRICLGSEWGFGGMHYHWQMGISWEQFTMEDLLRESESEAEAAGEEESAEPTATTSDVEEEDELLVQQEPSPVLILTLPERTAKHATESTTTTLTLFRSPIYDSSWQRMFRLRPRIRFGGCYISTVNYIRPGQAATTQFTWASPVHIVTYYRYLRFFRDGSVLSLLTTTEPAEVVHHVTKEKAGVFAKGSGPTAAGGANAPGAVMASALRGRWRMVGFGEGVGGQGGGGGGGGGKGLSPTDVEGDVVVETEGVMSKYIYRMDLSLRSSGGGGGKGSNTGVTRNNKLVWRGFYSYDRLTDDWAEFTLKNYKPFFFSRVRSYGVMGE